MRANDCIAAMAGQPASELRGQDVLDVENKTLAAQMASSVAYVLETGEPVCVAMVVVCGGLETVALG